MTTHRSLSEQQRATIIALFESGQSRDAVAKQLGVSPSAVRRLYDRWRLRGGDALVAQSTRRSYPFALKLEVVQRYLAGETAIALAQECDLASPKTVEAWARVYQADGEDGLRPKPRGRPRRDSTAPVPERSEVAQLRQENQRLRAEVAYLGKLRALSASHRR